GDFASAYGLCGTAKPDAPDFQRVSCARPHTWRALRSVDIPGQSGSGQSGSGQNTGDRSYPGGKAVQAQGVAPCTDAAREQAADALDFQWSYEWPSRRLWTGSQRRPAQRYGVCWAPADGT
ncbi:MAG: hypothetical protein ACRCYU_00040, partial [Nocardioides sp.]